jgi:hypothetical protein
LSIRVTTGVLFVQTRLKRLDGLLQFDDITLQSNDVFILCRRRPPETRELVINSARMLAARIVAGIFTVPSSLQN